MIELKMMIVDDEPRSRSGLRSLVEREIPDCIVVGEAEDGARALELVAECEPDLLLVDVRMPFMDGLELTERLSGMPGERSVIMVSGYDEFEYARKALQAKAADYLLKPVDPALLSAAVEKVRSELARRRDELGYLSWARSEMERNIHILRERFFLSLLDGSLSRSEADDESAFLGTALPERGRLIAVRLPERPSAFGEEPESARRLRLAALLIIARRSMEGFDPLFVAQDKSEAVAALVPEPGAEGIRLLHERCEAECRAAVLPKPVIAERKVSSDVAKLAEAWDDMRAELAQCDWVEAFAEKARAIVERRFTDPNLSLEEVAGELKLSPGYLSRLIKRDTGFGFVDYLTRCRIAKAVELVSDPTLKVFEAAEAVGYRSQHYFTRAFRKVLGVSPSEYRAGRNP
jgi:two-component system, response regulator YesN